MNLLDEIRVKHRKVWQEIMWSDAIPIVIKSQQPLTVQHNKIFVLGKVTNTVYVFCTERTDSGMTATLIESYCFAAQTFRPIALDIKPDGTRMYIASEDTVFEYSLSVPWEVCSGMYTGNCLCVGGGILDIEWHPAGIRLNVFLEEGCSVYEMATPWELFTGSLRAG